MCIQYFCRCILSIIHILSTYIYSIYIYVKYECLLSRSWSTIILVREIARLWRSRVVFCSCVEIDKSGISDCWQTFQFFLWFISLIKCDHVTARCWCDYLDFVKKTSFIFSYKTFLFIIVVQWVRPFCETFIRMSESAK